LQFLESEDKELIIELTVDSLRTFINKKNKSILLENPIFMDQVKNLYECSGNAVKGVIEDLLKKWKLLYKKELFKNIRESILGLC